MTLIRSLLQDARFAVRLLIKDRSFTLTALLTLVVCIGANTAIFSIVRSVLLRPLPVPASDRIVLIYNSYPNAGAARASTAVPDYFDRLREVTVFDEQAIYRRQGMTLGASGGAERVQVIRGTPSFFRLVQAHPIHGRAFHNQEGEEGQERKVLLSYGFWRRQFGDDAGAVGRTIRLSGQTYDIVGVLPANFKFLWNDIDLWIPAAFTANEKSDDARHSNNWTMIGRLKPGASLDQAQREIDALNARNDERFPQFKQVLKDAGFRSIAVGLQDDVVREVRPVIYLLWGGVLFVLVIGCVNIANLVMVRSSARARELATRHAIGAHLGRLSRQLLTETTLLSIVGGGLGILAGVGMLRGLLSLPLGDVPRSHEIALDPVGAAIMLTIAVAVGLGIAMVPIVRLSHSDLNVALREETRSGTTGRGTRLLRRALATAQVAIAFVVLIGAGLLLASFREVARVDPGFEPEGVVTAAINLPQAAYRENPAVVTFGERLIAGLRQIPGVEHAGVTTVIPFGGDMNSSVILAEGYRMQPGESLISPVQNVVSDGYFEAMKIGLVRGRYFTSSDTAASNPVAIVDERLAKKFWPGRDPIGRRLYEPSSGKDVFAITPETRFITVVGVVREVNVVPAGSDFDPVGAYYYPFSQSPARSMVMAVRTRLNPESAVDAIRKHVASLDRELPVYSVRTMAERVDEALVGRRLPMLIAIGFGVVAMFLAAIGIYGVLAYGVAERRREIGIRMALGSSAREVFRLVTVDGLKIIVIGLAIGLAGTFALARVIEKLLYGVRPMDLTVMSAVALVLAVVALVAVLIPARRAAKVNPAVALNQ